MTQLAFHVPIYVAELWQIAVCRDCGKKLPLDVRWAYYGRDRHGMYGQCREHALTNRGEQYGAHHVCGDHCPEVTP